MAQFPKIPSAGSWTKESSPGGAGDTRDTSSEGAATEEMSGGFRPHDAGTGGGVGFGSGTDESRWRSEGVSIKTTKAPEAFLCVALTAAAIALLLSLFFESVVVAGIGWVLSALVGLGASTIFVVQNARRQTSPWYLYSSRPQVLYRIAVVMCFLAIVATSVRIALFVGRM